MSSVDKPNWSSIPSPEDDGGTRHLLGAMIASVPLQATDGTKVDLSGLKGRTVVSVLSRFIVIIFISYGNWAGAASICQSEFITQLYRSCVAPTHPPVYNLGTCPIYKKCRLPTTTEKETLEMYSPISGWAYKQKCDGYDFGDKCLRYRPNTENGMCYDIWNSDQVFDQISKKYPGDFAFIKKYDGKGLDPNLVPELQKTPEWKIRGFFTHLTPEETERVRKIQDDQQQQIWANWIVNVIVSLGGKFQSLGEVKGNGTDAIQYVTCLDHNTIKLPIAKRDSQCGLEGYNQCRDASHGIETYENIRTLACGLEPNAVGVQPSYDAVKEVDRTGVCSTLDEMPASSDSQISSKMAALKQNLAMLTNSVNVSDPSFLKYSTSAQLAVQLEIYHLQSKLKPSPALNSSTKAEIKPLLKIYANGEVSAAFDLALAAGRSRMAQNILELYTEEAGQIRSQAKSGFAEMDTTKYGLLYTDGVLLTDTELQDAPNQIEIMGNNSIGAYRLAEAGIRTGLVKVAALHQRALNLMDLRVRLYRDGLNYQKLIQEYVKVTSEPAEKVNGRFAAYRDSNDRLREAAVNIINSNVKALIGSAENLKKSLWRMIDLANAHSTDPRLPLLNGYRSLVEINSSSFHQSLSDAIHGVTKAGSVTEFENSIQLLVRSAKNNLSSLKALEKLLSAAANERESLESAIIGKMADLSKDGNAGDQLAQLVFQALADFKGGPGSEMGLQDELLSLISNNYAEFLSALEKIPALEGK